MKHSVSVTCCALLVSSISLSYAAEVPSGTVLAEKQELVRHIKDEPARKMVIINGHGGNTFKSMIRDLSLAQIRIKGY